MSNETLYQAAIRAARVFLVAGLVALGADASNIVNIGTGNDVFIGPLILSIVIAAIEAALKAIGGPTEKMPVTRGRAGAGDADPSKRPNPLSI